MEGNPFLRFDGGRKSTQPTDTSLRPSSAVPQNSENPKKPEHRLRVSPSGNHNQVVRPVSADILKPAAQYYPHVSPEGASRLRRSRARKRSSLMYKEKDGQQRCSISELSCDEARVFLLTHESCCTIGLPRYFQCSDLLSGIAGIAKKLRRKDYQHCLPRDCDDVNHLIQRPGPGKPLCFQRLARAAFERQRPPHMFGNSSRPVARLPSVIIESTGNNAMRGA